MRTVVAFSSLTLLGTLTAFAAHAGPVACPEIDASSGLAAVAAVLAGLALFLKPGRGTPPT